MRLLLALVPRSFRDRHGEEVALLFQQMKAELGPRPGAFARVRLYAGLTWDLLRHAPWPNAATRPWRRVSGGFEAVATDTVFALRQYRRRWGTALTMLAILSLGLTLSIILFSFVRSYAFSPPLSIPPADDLVRIRGEQTVDPYGRVVRAFDEEEFAAYRALEDQFAAVTGWSETVLSMSVPDRYVPGAEAALTSFVTTNYFHVLGVRPALGRDLAAFASDDPTQESVVVISDLVWRKVFDSDPAVIGRTLHVQGAPLIVVGVAPPRFFGVGSITENRLWVPLSLRDEMMLHAAAEPPAFRVAARLREGVTPAAATVAVKQVAARFTADEYASVGARARTAEVLPLLGTNGDPQIERDVRVLALSLGALGLLVLLVTCTNVSALLMGVAVARRHEIVVRVSLGAGRARVIRQLLTETALLSVVAGAAALGLTAVVTNAAVATWPTIPLDLTVSTPAIVLTFTVALLAAILFGLAPTLHVTRLALATGLRDSSAAVGGGRHRLHRGLVIAQVAFTQPLVAALVAVLLLVVNQMQPPAHSDVSERLVALQLRTSTPSAVDDVALHADVVRLQTTLASHAGVAAVVPALQSVGDFGLYRSHPDDEVPGGMMQAFEVEGNAAAAGYFEAAGLPLVRGRDLTFDDARTLRAPGPPVPVIIGADLARRLWPDADPLGRRLQPMGDSAQAWAPLVVVGVVDRSAGAARGSVSHEIHVALDRAAVPKSLLIRTYGDAAPLLPEISRIARAEVPAAVVAARTIASIQQGHRDRFRVITAALASAGFVALLLSGIGLYAVVAFAVGQRSREIAVRMAIGAPSRRVARSFLGDGVRLGLTGLLFGLPVSLLGLHAFNTAIAAEAGIPPIQLPGVTAVVATVVVLTACAATLVPALRAAAIDPATTLRRA